MQDRLYETMPENIAAQLLAKIGFIDQSMRTIFTKLWVQMSGDLQGFVTLNNLRMFVLAVLGVHIQNGPHVDRQELTQVAIGKINR